jgi:hypothetical protein
MPSTTIKLSTETRDRIKAMGGDTYEDTIIEALDALESAQFWAQAEQAAEWRRSQPEDSRRSIAEREGAVDEAFDAVG